MTDKNAEKLLYCSFCGKSQHEVRKLIAGPQVFICDECIELCNDIIREELQAGAREEWFDRIKGFLEGERERGDYERVAGELSTTPNALKVAVHRLRTRLRELLREEVGQTVECADQVNQEIRDLIRILGG